MDVCCVLFLVCLYICVCECLLQNNIAGVPSSWATSGFPQYCASTCARFGCTRHASCVDSKPKKNKILAVSGGIAILAGLLCALFYYNNVIIKQSNTHTP